MAYVNSRPHFAELNSECSITRHPATPQLSAAAQRHFVERYGWLADREGELTQIKRINRGADLWPAFTAREVA